MATVFIGIDDTDNASSRGTGHLARQLWAECGQRGLRPLSVTRHQFLVDPRIPYTSHNSGACLAVESDNGAEPLEFAFDFVAERAAEGSDPGVCIAVADAVPESVVEFGKAATKRVIEIREAFETAVPPSVRLRGLGGTNQGVIGALGSVGLRASGNNGRFIDLPGLRELPSRVPAETFTCIGIRLAYKIADREPLPDDSYETLGWVRPTLRGGQPVLTVEWSKIYHAWIPVDRKKDRPFE